MGQVIEQAKDEKIITIDGETVLLDELINHWKYVRGKSPTDIYVYGIGASINIYFKVDIFDYNKGYTSDGKEMPYDMVEGNKVKSNILKEITHGLMLAINKFNDDGLSSTDSYYLKSVVQTSEADSMMEPSMDIVATIDYASTSLYNILINGEISEQAFKVEYNTICMEHKIYNDKIYRAEAYYRYIDEITHEVSK